MELEGISFRFLVAGLEHLILHDLHRADVVGSGEEICKTRLEIRDLISDVHWYPTDLGMVMFSTYSGKVCVWDLQGSQVLGRICFG